jgi:transposase
VTDRDDRERMYRALVAYQDEGLGLEEAAARFGVNPHTMRARMKEQGWRMRTWKQTGKRRHGSVKVIPVDETVRRSLDGEQTWALAQEFGVSVRRMQEWLREHGVDGRKRFITAHAQRQSDQSRDRVERIMQLRAEGLTYGQIAIRTGHSRGYVSAVASRYQRKRYRWQQDTNTTTEG